MEQEQVFTQFLLVAGGLIATIVGLVTALIPGLAWVIVCNNLWDDTWYVRYLPLSPQLHDLTPGMLISVAGSILALYVFISNNNRLVPLSLTGNVLGILGTLGFLFGPGYRGSGWLEISCSRPTWIGFYFTLVGVMLLLVGSFFRYNLKYRLTLLGVPLLLVLYTIPLINPIFIILNNHPHFLSRPNVVISYMIAILFILGYGLPIFGILGNTYSFNSDVPEPQRTIEK